MVLRVGLIGAAWGGIAHVPAWRSIPGVEVAAVCTSREETARAAADRFGIERAFWDPLALCADPGIDILDCGTRPSLRTPWLMAALAHGKHIYNASPHAPGWEEAKAIDAAWRGSGCVTALDAFAELIPAVRQQIAMVRDGYLGEPVSGTCHFNISLFNTPHEAFPYNWFGEAGAGVSAIRNNGSHALYPLLAMFGPVRELVADDRQALPEWRFASGAAITPATNDIGNVLLRFANGVVMQLQASWAMVQHDGWLLDVFGTEGRLMTRSPTFPTAGECRLFGARRRDKANPHAATDLPEITPDPAYLKAARSNLTPDVPIAPAFPMALAMEAMVGAIEEGSALLAPDFGTALEVERILEAIRLSQARRAWVTIAEVG